eukprot:1160640-Pelagomonas_calceolata.AAC.10
MARLLCTQGQNVGHESDLKVRVQRDKEHEKGKVNGHISYLVAALPEVNAKRSLATAAHANDHQIWKHRTYVCAYLCARARVCENCKNKKKKKKPLKEAPHPQPFRSRVLFPTAVSTWLFGLHGPCARLTLVSVQLHSLAPFPVLHLILNHPSKLPEVALGGSQANIANHEIENREMRKNKGANNSNPSPNFWAELRRIGSIKNFNLMLPEGRREYAHAGTHAHTHRAALTCMLPFLGVAPIVHFPSVPV